MLYTVERDVMYTVTRCVGKIRSTVQLCASITLGWCDGPGPCVYEESEEGEAASWHTGQTQHNIFSGCPRLNAL